VLGGVERWEDPVDVSSVVAVSTRAAGRWGIDSLVGFGNGDGGGFRGNGGEGGFVKKRDGISIFRVSFSGTSTGGFIRDDWVFSGAVQDRGGVGRVGTDYAVWNVV
jgi:hypothetical protein